jgi:PucR C-terminal helix-turn-helix domain/GGDEF-like domain
MAETASEATLRSMKHALGLLAQAGVIPKAAVALETSQQRILGVLRDTVLAEVPAFLASANPDILPEFGSHASEHTAELCRLLSGGEAGHFEFVREHARRRAEQRFPLEAMLHAYRCGHKVLSRWMRDAAVVAVPSRQEHAVPAIADFAIEYTNAISSIATSEYVSHMRVVAEAEVDRRSELLNLLLSGCDESDARAASLLKGAGYLEQRQSYCVAVARSVNVAEMESPARAQRIASALSEAFAGTSIRALSGVRENLAVAVLSGRRRQSGWTTPQAELSGRVQESTLVLGTAVLTGLSTDQPSTSFIPKALHEAKIALGFTSVANRVVKFSELPLRALLLHHGQDHIRATPPAWVTALTEADTKAGGALVQTLRALGDACMNTQEAGRILGKHPNTVYVRIARIKELTGLDGHRYHDLTELLLAADCWRR